MYYKNEIGYALVTKDGAVLDTKESTVTIEFKDSSDKQKQIDYEFAYMRAYLWQQSIIQKGPTS